MSLFRDVANTGEDGPATMSLFRDVANTLYAAIKPSLVDSLFRPLARQKMKALLSVKLTYLLTG